VFYDEIIFWCRQAFLDRNAISRVFLSEVVSLRQFYLIRAAVLTIRLDPDPEN
jgi:hypothetical protein